jgi:hypothetical protein
MTARTNAEFAIALIKARREQNVKAGLCPRCGSAMVGGDYIRFAWRCVACEQDRKKAENARQMFAQLQALDGTHQPNAVRKPGA